MFGDDVARDAEHAGRQTGMGRVVQHRRGGEGMTEAVRTERGSEALLRQPPDAVVDAAIAKRLTGPVDPEPVVLLALQELDPLSLPKISSGPVMPTDYAIRAY